MSRLRSTGRSSRTGALHRADDGDPSRYRDGSVDIALDGGRPGERTRHHVGTLQMCGHFVAQHKDEILDFLRSALDELRSANQAPAIQIDASPACSIEIVFDPAPPARDIGQMLYHKYWGELDVRVEDGGETLRVIWWR